MHADVTSVILLKENDTCIYAMHMYSTHDINT